MNEPVFEITSGYAELNRPHVAEWFGHRVFPLVSGSAAAVADQKAKRCPFLSTAFRTDHLCVKLHKEGPAKTGNSEGVCTISSTSNGPRQDWIVCPVRALDDHLLERIVRHLYRVPTQDSIQLTPVAGLADPAVADSMTQAVHHAHERVFVYFQNKVPKQHPSGGEIRLRKTTASPAMSFDTTIVELLPAQPDNPPDAGAPLAVRPGRYGVVELQTADTHGSYNQAVAALRNAIDLHPEQFHAQLAANPEWARRAVEGPNVANVFKRTIYQVAFKFQVTSQDTSVVASSLSLSRSGIHGTTSSAPRTSRAIAMEPGACSTTPPSSRATGSTSSTSPNTPTPPAVRHQSRCAESSAPTPPAWAAPRCRPPLQRLSAWAPTEA